MFLSFRAKRSVVEKSPAKFNEISPFRSAAVEMTGLNENSKYYKHGKYIEKDCIERNAL